MSPARSSVVRASRETMDVMMINAENRVLIRTQEPDAGIYAKHYSAAGLSGADITSQEPSEHQYVRFLAGGKPVGPISMVPLGWPTPLTIMPDPFTFISSAKKGTGFPSNSIQKKSVSVKSSGFPFSIAKINSPLNP